MNEDLQIMMKRYKLNPANKDSLNAYKASHPLGDPKATLNKIRETTQKIKDLESTYDKFENNVNSVSMLLRLRAEKADFAASVKEDKDKTDFEIPPSLRKTGRADTTHFQAKEGYDTAFNWTALYPKGKIFFLYRVVIKRLINKLILRDFPRGSPEDTWKKLIIQQKKWKQELFFEVLNMKEQRMHQGSKGRAAAPPATVPPAGEGKKKRRRGRGKNKEGGEPAGESRARSQSKGRPVNPPKD